MYCKKCGKQNDEDAIYCQKCGILLENEIETRVVSRAAVAPDTGNETTLFAIGPTMKFIIGGYALAALSALLMVALIGAFTPIPIWIAVIVGLLLFLVPAYFHLMQKLVTYRLTDRCIEIDAGLIARTTQNIPLTRIQDVTVTSTITQRLLNFGDLVIDNASEDGGKIVIKNIDSPKKYADILLGQMRRLER